MSEQIRQLVVSPNGELLAILTSHTVHIAILPDSSHLVQPDAGPIRLKTHTLGPTTHVLSQSPIVSALWHPLGVGGNCLVTVTTEAVVRLWELDRANRWSFDSPALAVDLRKLKYGTSAEDDFSAARIGDNRGFSVDAFDMEVSAACFGGTGSESESGWSSMTLWVAMSAGDVYALCPFLPSKWEPPLSLVPSLTTTVAAMCAYAQEEILPLEEQRQYDEQFQWLSAIDKQEPSSAKREFITEPEYLIYDRPTEPGPIPRLQGPFCILPDDIEEDLELSDIYVIAAKINLDDFMAAEEGDSDMEAEREGLSATVVNLLTRQGTVYICLDLEGVEAKWLPSKMVGYVPSTKFSMLTTILQSRPKSTLDAVPQPELVLLEALDTLRQVDLSDSEWPTFTPDIHSRYSFFTTHSRGVFYFSCEPWLGHLESELQTESNEGLAFRAKVLANGSGTLRERILTPERVDDEAEAPDVTAPILIQDSDLGYFLLTSFNGEPRAVTFHTPQDEPFEGFIETPNDHYEAGMKLLSNLPARSPYQAPQSLWMSSSLPTFLEKHAQGRYRKLAKSDIRMSSATLDILTEAHRVISHETHQLGLAAADLFRRCDRLRKELREQINLANDAANKIERLNDEDADDYDEDDEGNGKKRGSARIEERLQTAKERQTRLRERCEALRKKATKVGVRDLSDKEKEWAEEIKKLEPLVAEAEVKEDTAVENAPWHRFSEVRTLAKELVAQAKDFENRGSAEPNGNTTFKVPPDIRKAKVSQVMSLLEREYVSVPYFRSSQPLTLSIGPLSLMLPKRD